MLYGKSRPSSIRYIPLLLICSLLFITGLQVPVISILATILSLMAYGGCVLMLKFNLPIWPEIS